MADHPEWNLTDITAEDAADILSRGACLVRVCLTDDLGELVDRLKAKWEALPEEARDRVELAFYGAGITSANCTAREIPWRVQMLGVTFSGDASFVAATFSADAHFTWATFSGDAGFNSATFSGDADFHVATFMGRADFSGATFSGDVSFWEATFSGDARFD